MRVYSFSCVISLQGLIKYIQFNSIHTLLKVHWLLFYKLSVHKLHSFTLYISFARYKAPDGSFIFQGNLLIFFTDIPLSLHKFVYVDALICQSRRRLSYCAARLQCSYSELLRPCWQVWDNVVTLFMVSHRHRLHLCKRELVNVLFFFS